MNNVLLDDLPEKWEAPDGTLYSLNTSFSIGMQICLAQDDPELTMYEKIQVAKDLLFDGDYPRDQQEMSDCLEFFLHGWHHDGKSSRKQDKRLMDFDIDQWRIYSAFLQFYHIDLNKEDMHWWRFMGLLSCLPKCSYTQVIDIRQRDFKPKMDKEERKQLREAKEVYELKKVRSREEQAFVEEMDDLLGGGSVEDEKRREIFESYADEVI